MIRKSTLAVVMICLLFTIASCNYCGDDCEQSQILGDGAKSVLVTFPAAPPEAPPSFPTEAADEPTENESKI